ncbi:hypothetical protein SAMN05421759_10989 [Roseivivax lentus]|uniref:Uncharacterized protein n=1 Tax=Roseivivax lentus TaxID=633194 RepID=A0A1N7NPQ6_9RHOB|nr:hypothetical protein [Roseivivax lentus]SIT00218.1 hypothetical protein SAMN05421759_10989 [Roseivivax lentus]
MSLTDSEYIQSLFQQFMQDELNNLPQAERQSLSRAFEARFGQLIRDAAGGKESSFPDLVGFGSEGVTSFDEIPPAYIEADFDEGVTPSQLQASAELYFILQHDIMGVFKSMDILRRQFRDGTIRIQRGPGAQKLYLLEKWRPLRYGPRDRSIAYGRVFNHGRGPKPAGAVINRNFQHQFVALISSLAKYYRDLTVSEVVRGGPALDSRPYGAIATVQRIAIDLRYALDRSSYGNIVSLTHESGMYLSEALGILDSPDIKRAYDATNRWQALEGILKRNRGSISDLSQRAKMAEAGRRILQWVAGSTFDSDVDADSFRVQARTAGSHAEAWIAAYRLTKEGRHFPGANANLKWSRSLPYGEQETAYY